MAERIKADVLVVGAGGAGMMAAAEAARTGARVVLVCKSRAMRGGATVMAPGAVAAVNESWKTPEDSVDLHIEDTLSGGEGLGDPYLVSETAQLAGDMIKRLESMGAMFQRTDKDDDLALRITGGHTFPRSLFIENRVGREICRALWGELSRLGVEIVEEAVVTRILVSDGAVLGAKGLLLKNASPIIFLANRVILATGGAGRMYEMTDNPDDVTGDGFALALMAGAQLSDMEFVQFYPISFLSPAYARGQVAGFPAYARLFNSKNDRFMRHYDARLELATRDMLCIAISKEVREGRGSLNGGVYCSLEHCAKDSLERELPGLFAIYRAAGIEPYTDRFEVGPSAHFFQGGVRVNRNRMTRISGLYAVGETAAGMHGANRLGQNALTDILVSGFIAGRHAAAMSNTVNAQVHESDIADTHLQNAGGSSLIQQRELRLQIRSIMQRGAGVLRDRVGLELAAKELSLCRSSLANCNRKADGVCARTAIENISMLLSAACVVKSALMREESRGCHYRDDYPQMDDSHWLKNTVAELDRDEIVMSTVQTETLKQNHTAEAQ